MENLCPWESPTFFGFFSSNVPALLYYSHILALAVAVLWGVFILLNAKKDIRSYSLLGLFTFFSIWNVFDLWLWATNRPDVTMFLWSLQVLLEILVFLFAFYTVYTYQSNKNVPVKGRILIAIGILPLILLIPTEFNLIGVYLEDCVAIENVVAGYYSYFLEAVFIIAISLVTLKQYKTPENKTRKKEITIIGIGTVTFLMMFIYGNLIGSFLDDWVIAQFGLFGMPIFVTLLVYATVKFKTFNIKLIGSQALIVILWILVGSTLLIRTIENVRIITSITLIILLILGIQLVRSVKREIEQKEKIAKLALDLEKANTRLRELDQLKSQFLSFASHQIRSPLTAIKGYTSMALEGDFGQMSDKTKEVVTVIDKSAQSLVTIVNEFLDVSRIEQGRMKYEMVDVDIRDIVKEVVDELRPNVEQKGLQLQFNTENQNLVTHADKGKIKQVVGNLIDNSIKYTPKGSITVSIKKMGEKARVEIKDTGIGIAQEDMKSLFSMFTRARDAHKTNVSGTGLGLYVAKQMIEAHKGKVWVESKGHGLGSTFFIELPLRS